MDVEVLPASAVAGATQPAAAAASSSVTITPVLRPPLAGASKRKSGTPTRAAAALAAPAAVQMEPVDLRVRHDLYEDNRGLEVGSRRSQREFVNKM